MNNESEGFSVRKYRESSTCFFFPTRPIFFIQCDCVRHHCKTSNIPTSKPSKVQVTIRHRICSTVVPIALYCAHNGECHKSQDCYLIQSSVLYMQNGMRGKQAPAEPVHLYTFYAQNLQLRLPVVGHIPELQLIIDYRCDDSRFWVSTSSLSSPNPALLSSSETRVHVGIRS